MNTNDDFINEEDVLRDEDVLNEHGSIKKTKWKEYWRQRELDPETRREVRKEKAAHKKRLHRKSRSNARKLAKDWINKIKENY